MRTDISEDPKGDPSRIIPQQPVPGGVQQDEDVEPLIPRVDAAEPAPDPASQTHKTDADRRGQSSEGG